MNRAVLIAVAVLLTAAPATLAAETDGVGANVRHVKNIEYRDLHKTAGDYHSAGTDLEFAVLSITRRADVRRMKRLFGRRPLDLDRRKRGLQRRFAIAGSYEDGLHVIDVTEPEKATEVTLYDCSVGQGDVQVFTREDKPGRTYVAYTQDDGYGYEPKSACWAQAAALGFKLPELSSGSAVQGGTLILDVTNPLRPRTVSFALVEGGSHNQTVHPSGRYLYNSGADLITDLAPTIDVIDISDLRAPKLVATLDLLPIPGLGAESHDISFSADGTTAYSAALSHGVIIDTTDPANPRTISRIVDPAINVWHQMEAITIDDPLLGEREFLIAEDEFAGAEGTSQCPNGAVHVFDITGSNRNAPVPVGYFNIDEVRPTGSTDLAAAYTGRCTAHVFQLHREAKLMTMGWYNGGVRVIDISGLAGLSLGAGGMGMRQVGFFRFEDSDTWAAKAPLVDRSGFWLFGNDKIRGFDVYRYEPAGDAMSPGVWRTPREALATVAGARVPRRAVLPASALCMVR